MSKHATQRTTPLWPEGQTKPSQASLASPASLRGHSRPAGVCKIPVFLYKASYQLEPLDELHPMQTKAGSFFRSQSIHGLWIHGLWPAMWSDPVFCEEH
jgi:hypothetical protein